MYSEFVHLSILQGKTKAMLTKKLIISLLLIFAIVSPIGCIQPPPAVTKIAIEALWAEKPLENLVERLSPVYAPEFTPHDMPLTDIFWQVPTASITTSGTPQLLSTSQWSLEMKYGSNPSQLWLYSSNDITQVSELMRTLKKYQKTEQNVTVLIDNQTKHVVPLQQTQDQSGYAVTFKTAKADVAIIWFGKSLNEIQPALNSLTVLLPHQALTQKLEQEMRTH